MNERIKELVEQAIHIEEPDGLFPREVFDREKFAKLIVKKCAEISLSHQDFPETEQTIRRWVTEDIERHFGVKK